MSEKLTDPSKAAHEIVEVLEDGDAVRNDGVRLTAANKNPWYVLATIHGEQEEFTDQNQHAWNNWVAGTIHVEQRNELTELFRQRMNFATVEVPDRSRQINFSNTYFPNGLDCSGFEFRKTVLFGSSVFERTTNFVAARFRGNACFQDVKFKGQANFSKAIFGTSSIGGANFRHARFGRGAYFRSTVFNEDANFQSARFHGESNFSSAQFKAPTDFEKARFLTSVPKFEAAEIYDNTLFPTGVDDVGNWPPLSGVVHLEGQEHPVEVMDAEDQKRAYNRLRLFMNRSLKIDEEQFFHRQEMRCKREMAVGVHKWIYWTFEKISDYGISVKGPVGGLAVSIGTGTFVLMLYLGMGGRVADGSVFWESLGWSVSNSVPFLGYGKLYYGANYVEDFHWGIKAMAGLQTFAGYVLLFFLGLGLRNQFRLR